MRRSARHGWLLLALLLIGGAAYLLLDDPIDADLSGAELAIQEPSEEERAMLLGEAPADASAPKPTLSGSRRARDDRRGDVLVTVIGPTGVPLSGVELTTAESNPKNELARWSVALQTTGADGKALLRDLPWDGSKTVRPVSNGPTLVVTFADDRGRVTMGKQDAASVVVEGPTALLQLPRGIPIELDCLDAETGDRIACDDWTVKPAFDGVVTAAGSRVAAVGAGDSTILELTLPEFRDGLAWDGRKWTVSIAPGVKRLRAFYPLRRVAEVTVLFPAENEPRSADAWSAQATIVGRSFTPPKHMDSFRRIHLDGIPHLPGETVSVSGAMGKSNVSGSVRLSATSRDPAVIRASLAKAGKLVYFATKLNVDIQHVSQRQIVLANALGQHQRAVIHVSDGSFRLALNALGRLQITKDEAPTTGALELTVRRPSGRPAKDARVHVAGRNLKLSRNGTVLVQDLAPGEHEVLVWGAGAVFTRKVSIDVGRKTRHDWTGPRGGNVEVEVVDENDRPVPFATLTVKQTPDLPWVDVVGDEQRVDPFTDARGRRTLHRLVGTVSVSASFGSRTGSAYVDVREGRTERLRVKLGQAAPPPNTPKSEK